MTAYCFFDVLEVTDPEGLEEYRGHVRDTVKHHGGRYLLVGGELEPIEGDRRPTFPVLIEFPSLEHARRWYGSDEYRRLKELRLSATRGMPSSWRACPRSMPRAASASTRPLW
jgi:uncharacterized protein (DUF1330 family)